MTNQKPCRPARWWVGNALVAAGVIGIVAWACSWLGLALWQAWQNRVFDHRRSVPRISRRETRVEDGDIVGRLIIPRVHIRAMVREGDGDRALSVALGHIPGTAFPGQPGNIGVAGHRDSLFRELANIAANDEITFETSRDTYVYRVEDTGIVKPEDTGVLASGPNRELTLVTCYPFEYVGSAPDRFIVKARLVSEEPAENGIREKPLRTAAAIHPKVVAPSLRDEIAFEVPARHSRELVPGKIWFGLSSVNPVSHTVNGWIWVMPERRTTWLRDFDMREPVVFYQNGGRCRLVIAGVARNSARGYLVPPPGSGRLVAGN